LSRKSKPVFGSSYSEKKKTTFMRETFFTVNKGSSPKDDKPVHSLQNRPALPTFKEEEDLFVAPSARLENASNATVYDRGPSYSSLSFSSF
jgi:hypothetical protein